ncbi:MAG: extracellular solute-binding protein [Phycisphaerales bacterium]|nr:extracellular solute-binding protein [Phycisphaerales bacterium]MCB9862795.1 extracellular solute-binding protein [Phycisphaerales bacterium]
MSAAIGVALCIFSGCDSSGKQNAATTAVSDQVVVYCSVDRMFAEPLLDAFSKETGIEVNARFDTEAGKTTGLVNKLLAERSQPRADVWWSSEVFGTIELANAGVLASYRPATAEGIPARFVDPQGRWTAFGMRGRVLAFDPKRTKRVDAPTAWADLSKPEYRGRVAMADPRFGTTRGHFSAMLSEWGEASFEEFLKSMKSNAVVRADGNSHAVLLLAQGRVDFAATDTDDVIVARQRGDSIDAVYPDMSSPNGRTMLPGTLWIPCSVALVNGARNETAAKRLIDYIASARMEEALYASESHNVPVREALRRELGIDDVRAADVDYVKAAAALRQSGAMIDRVDPFRRE